MLAPIVAHEAALGIPTRPKALYLNGVDLVLEPGTSGNRPGVPIESVQLEEAGPGGVSSLSFTIEDPAGTWAIPGSGWVLYMDVARDVPLFLGWLSTFAPAAWGVGRRVDVKAVGVEALLDWWYVPVAVSWGTSLVDGDAATVVQSIVAQAVPGSTSFPLNVDAAIAFGVGALSSRTSPVSGKVDILTAGSAGPGTLREVLARFAACCGLASLGGFTYGAVVTVDAYGGLRFMDPDGNGAANAADWPAYVVGAPARPLADHESRVELGDAVHAVWVKGSTAAGTGLVTDGTGIAGPLAVYSDANAVDAATLASVGAAYLARRSATQAGTFTLEDPIPNVGSPGAQVRAGGRLTITDAAAGLAGVTVPIGRITKRYLAGGGELWTIDYGSRIRSGAALLRRLTRDVLS